MAWGGRCFWAMFISLSACFKPKIHGEGPSARNLLLDLCLCVSVSQLATGATALLHLVRMCLGWEFVFYLFICHYYYYFKRVLFQVCSVSWELRKCFGFSAGTHRPNLSLIAKINISLVKITLKNSQPTMQASRDTSKSNCLSLSVKRAFFRFGFVGRNVQKTAFTQSFTAPGGGMSAIAQKGGGFCKRRTRNDLPME